MTTTPTLATPFTGTTPAATLADLADDWMIYLRCDGKAKNTMQSYDRGVREFVRWHTRARPGVPVTVADLDRATVTAFLADSRDTGSSPGTCRARYSALRQFARWCEETGETDTDVLLGTRPPKGGQRRVDALSDAELDALIKACRAPAGADARVQFEAYRDRAAVELLGDSGLRAGECVALTTEDVDLRRGIVRVRYAKGDKSRISVFGDDAAKAVLQYKQRARRTHKRADLPQLWLGSQSRTTWAYHGLHQSLARRATTAGIKGFHPHRLRHTAASRMLRDGMSEGEVMALLGWSNRAMLDVYTADTRQDRAVASAVKMFEQRKRGGR